MIDDQSPPLSPVVDISTVCNGLQSQCNATDVTPINQNNDSDTQESVKESKNYEPSQDSASVIEPPSFDDIEFYDDPTTGKTYYLDSKTKRIFEIAPNDEIGVFVKQL